MNDVVVEVNHVWKKFRRGEVHDSLRDLIPAIAKRLMGRTPPRDQLAEGDFWALRDVSFVVRRNESLGIIGPNGAGKSTLLKILSRILRPTRGSFRVEGKLRALIEVAAGFHPDLTGRENVYLNGSILGMSTREIDRKLEAIVDFSGIAPFIDTPVKRYSSGMQARLGFSVAAHLEPDVLLVDEVLAVGDALFQEKCLERMNQIVQSGAGIVFISHDLRAIVTLCEKCILLRQGEIQAWGDTADVVSQYTSDTHLVHERHEENQNCRITRIRTVSGADNGQLTLTAGDHVRIEVEIEAKQRLEQASLEIHVHDKSDQLVFKASILQLGQQPQTLEAGDRMGAVFDLDLNLGGGVYGLGLAVRRAEHALNYMNQNWLMPWHVVAHNQAGGACYLNCQMSQFEVNRQGSMESANNR